MDEIKVFIPARLKNAAKNGHVAGTEDIYDDALQKTQKEINAEQEGSIAAEIERATGVEEFLQSEISGLNSQNYVSVDSYSELPDLGNVDTVYRVGSWDGTQVDSTKYAEYAWNNTGIDQGEYKLLDVKDYGIDDEPTAGSENLVKSGGVAEKYGDYEESPEFVEVHTDAEDKILYGVKGDGDFYFGAGVPNQIQEEVDAKVDKIPGKGLSTNDYDNTAKAIVDTNELVENPEFIQVTTDSEDKILEGFKIDGIKVIETPLEIQGVRQEIIDYSEYVKLLLDAENKIVGGFKKDGKFVAFGGIEGVSNEIAEMQDSLSRIENIVKVEDNGFTQSDIVYNLYYGRSLSYHGTCPESDSRFTNLMFDLSEYGSPASMLLNVTSDIIDNQAALDALFRGFCPALPSNNIVLANRALTMFLKQENNINDEWENENTLEPKYQYQFLGCNPGEVTNWNGLVDSDGLPYKRLLKSVEFAKKFADEMGKTFSVGTICWAQAEDTNGNSPKTRYDCIWVAASKLNHDIKAITGQTEDIWFLTYQVASGQGPDGEYNNISFADLQIWLDSGLAPDGYELDSTAASQLPSGYELINRDRIQAGPIMCALSYRAVTQGGTDHVHATEKSYHAMAVQYALQMKRCMYDEHPFKPIHILSKTVTEWENGKYIIRLKMHVPVKPLVFDTTGGEVYSGRALGAAGNYGFSLLNNYDIDIIEDVEIVRGEEIKIITNENPSGLTLYYARDGWEHGGNLRDSQDITYTDSIIGEYHFYNWCPICKIVI